ncbi:odorant receptor 67c [Diachasma alloeum]|uniref:Odorant receptor n=1 Tax=Diachasma alloeum TaxID=454923 RepID=A0A4E0RZ55_9HYME|nr:odorant receptor 67c [Diachasma alloeum]THK33201.1 odorant receptor 146 [Diachasma alloeum]
MSAVTDLWNHTYYKAIRIIATCVGQWPYQTGKKLVICRIVTFSILSLQFTTQVLAAWAHRDRFVVFMECLSPFLLDAVAVIKYVNNCCHFKTMVYLLERMKYNWKIFPKDNGLHMLHEHSAYAKKYAAIYLSQLWLSVFTFIAEPFEKKLIYHFLYPDVHLPKKFPIPINVPLDVDTWYYYLWATISLSKFVRITLIGACDLLYLTFAEHARGFFKALGYVIENIPPHDESEGVDRSFEYLRSCAILHNRAIEFAEHVRDVYLWSYLGVIITNTLMITGTGVQVVHNYHNTEKLIKFTINLTTQLFHLFIQCYTAQRVMDASFDLKDALTNAKWFNASKKAQKLIPLMVMRAQNPVVITAGKMFVMNMNLFTVVVKTAGSYLTVLLALQ